jgi:predicted hydrocarbon binding protein
MTRQLHDLTQELIEEVLGDGSSQFDLAGGTVTVAESERRIYVTTETLYGIYKALANETGDAWGVILEGCGADWGGRVFERLDRELAARSQQSSGDVTVDDFCGFVEQFFSYYGWGRMRIEVSDVQNSGIVRCTLEDSLMAEALADEVEGPVDYLVAGILRAIFSRIAGQDLSCLQISCESTGSGSVSEFVVSAPERIDSIASLAGQASVDDAIEQLRAA